MKYLFRPQYKNYGYNWFNLGSNSRSKCTSIRCTSFTSREDPELEISPIVVPYRSTTPLFLLVVIVLMVIDYPLCTLMGLCIRCANRLCDSRHLTYWDRVTHICIGKLTNIGSDNGLSPGRRQAIIWINAGTLLIGPLETDFSEILIEISTFSLKVSSAKWRPFCLGLNMLNGIITYLITWLLSSTVMIALLPPFEKYRVSPWYMSWRSSLDEWVKCKKIFLQCSSSNCYDKCIYQKGHKDTKYWCWV